MKKNYDDEQENTTAYRVRLLRQDREWSQKELADKVFVTHSQISHWKAEKPPISAAPCWWLWQRYSTSRRTICFA